MQTSEAALVEMVELNDEDLLVVSGGVVVTIGGTISGAISGAGGTATANRNTGIATSSGSSVFNSSFTAGGPTTITFP